MDDKRVPVIVDTPIHRKKSKKKGRARADHKHIYEDVLLLTRFPLGRDKYGNECFSLDRKIASICKQCGRIGDGHVLSLFKIVVNPTETYSSGKRYEYKVLPVPEEYGDIEIWYSDWDDSHFKYAKRECWEK